MRKERILSFDSLSELLQVLVKQQLYRELNGNLIDSASTNMQHIFLRKSRVPHTALFVVVDCSIGTNVLSVLLVLAILRGINSRLSLMNRFVISETAA